MKGKEMLTYFRDFGIRVGTMVVAVLLLCPAVYAVDWFTETGYNQLKAELGNAMPTGAGVHVGHIEVGGPDTTLPQFAGKTFTYFGQDGSAPRQHTTNVGSIFYGSVYKWGEKAGQAPGVTQIDSWATSYWHSDPTNQYQNNKASVMCGAGDTSKDPIAIRKLDYSIATNHFLGVSPFWPPYTAGFNGMAIAVWSRKNSSPPIVDGRILVPDIVGPSDPAKTTPSWTTPTLASVATLLLSYANSQKLTAARDNPETVIKAVLMAGARKDVFKSWSHTPTQPLDLSNGAGMLNTYNSYHILAAGQQAAGSAATVSGTGWDYTAAGATGQKMYFFEVATTAPFTAVLDWNRNVNKTDWSYSLPHLNLKLYKATVFTLGNLVDQSASTTDNVQLIYETTLSPGRYALAVTGDTDKQRYALAWQTASKVNTAVTVPPATR